MDKPTDKEQEPHMLTESEIAECVKKEQELLTRWCENLPAEEAVAWIDAHLEDMVDKIDQLQQERVDFEAIARVVRGHRTVGEAIDFVRKKEHRTLVEAEALDAFERVKGKPIRVK